MELKLNEQSRWESPVFWSMLLTSIVGLLSAMGFWMWVGVPEDTALRVVGAVIAVFSIVVNGANNPTDKKNW